MIVSAATQIRGLAKAVATAFASSNLLPEERNPPGGIANTDLPWACPPLLTDLVLDGAMQDHLDAPIPTTSGQLRAFWHEAMHMAWYEPSRLLKSGVYASLSKAMPHAKMGQRALRFSVPIGAPGKVDESAGITLSLEVAHCAAISLPTSDIITSDNDYIVVTADGMEFGVHNGRPIIDSPWQMDVSGMVSDILLGARGEISYTCNYTQIDAVRSVLHTHRRRFPTNFEALDLALQALRYLSLGGYCPELVTQMAVKPMDERRWKEKERAYFDSIDVIRSRMSDRAKLYTLRDRLVPSVMTVTKFKREIFSASTFPFSMAPGKTQEIEHNLIALYKNEIPIALQRAV